MYARWLLTFLWHNFQYTVPYRSISVSLCHLLPLNSPSRMNDREPKWFSLFFRSILKYDCGTDTCESRVKNVTSIYADSFWLRPTYVLVYRSMSAVYPVPSAECRVSNACKTYLCKRFKFDAIFSFLLSFFHHFIF